MLAFIVFLYTIWASVAATLTAASENFRILGNSRLQQLNSYNPKLPTYMQIWDLSCHPEDFSPKDLIPYKAGRFFASLRMTYGKF